MQKQGVLSAFMTFFKDLPKAAFICHISMIGPIGIYFMVGKHFIKYLAATGKFNLQSSGIAIAAELIIVWIIAFALAVKARPSRQEEFCQYPPLNMSGGAFGISILLGMIFGTISGAMMGFGVLKPVVYILPAIFVMHFLVVFLFVPTIPGTRAAIKMKRDITVAIADSYRNTWLFSALALLITSLLLKWLAGEEPGLTPYFVTLHSSMITAVSYTGFASGFYP